MQTYMVLRAISGTNVSIKVALEITFTISQCLVLDLT